MNDWYKQHENVINDFISYLNARSIDFILKGETAQKLCYNLDRFSEDIDLDGIVERSTSLISIVDEFCKSFKYSYRSGKHTDTVERYFINYGNEGKPLKIEVSYRRRDIHEDEIDVINGVLVYRIEPLCVMKAMAYFGRDRIRDLYDLSFICKNHFDELSQQAIAMLRNAVDYKGIEQLDYILKTQHDELIDKEKLTEDFLNMFNILGLLSNEDERQCLSEMVPNLYGNIYQKPPTPFREQ